MSKYGLEIILPEKIQENFELKKVEDLETEWKFHLIEKEDKIPPQVQHRSGDEKICKNGYMKPVELTTFLTDKPCYLIVKRRRWKIQGGKKSYHNTYDLHPKGIKCTYGFLAFLKSIGRRSRAQFFDTWSDIRHIRQEDFSMVSKLKRLCLTESRDDKSLRN